MVVVATATASCLGLNYYFCGGEPKAQVAFSTTNWNFGLFVSTGGWTVGSSTFCL